ncbi:MAG: cell wall-binding repeat-containing protein, partial [Actinomycetota bacterium]|nr:cell wall-binding repeat-containing protein [Actinomycetota bacterium]
PPPALADGESALSTGYDPRATKVLRSLAVAADVAVAETPDVGATPGSSSEIPGSPVAGTLAAGTDDVDVYWIDLAATDRVGLTIAGDAALNADVYLYAPGTTDIVATGALAGTTGDAFVKSVTHRAGTAGRYYVAVAAASGTGSYTLSWYRSPWNADADSEIPGVARTSPFAGSLSVESDPDDVFPVAVAEGQRLTVSLDSWDSALAPQLHLFGPGAGSILTANPLAASVSGPVRSFSYDVPAGSGNAGTYYIDVRAVSGSGDYTLSWTVGPLSAGTWKNIGDAIVLPASPASAALQAATAANVVYRVTMTAGQRLDARLVSPAGADFDVYVYPSGTANLFATPPIVWADNLVGEDRVVFDAPSAGTYYVEVRRFTGDGTFALHWALGLTPTLGAAERVWGVDRYLTAIETSKATFGAASCPTVVIATGADFPDALAASGLAGAYGSPVLLTPTAALPGGLVNELKRLGATKVVIVGGPAAVSANAENQLKAAGFATSRAQGLTRYETAADVARKIRAITGARSDSPAFVVRGDLFPDALAAAPIAYKGAFPVLLTQSTAL